MAAAPKCDVCSDSHWPHQAHRFAKPVAVETLDYMRAGGTFVVSVEPTFAQVVDRVVDRALGVTGVCEVCSADFSAKRSDARFCGAKCRQASSRKRRKA